MQIFFEPYLLFYFHIFSKNLLKTLFILRSIKLLFYKGDNS